MLSSSIENKSYYGLVQDVSQPEANLLQQEILKHKDKNKNIEPNKFRKIRISELHSKYIFHSSHLLSEIFSQSMPADLRNCLLVSKQWKQLANAEGENWIRSKIAFDRKRWQEFFGEVGQEPALPRNIFGILTAQCKFWPDKHVWETHKFYLVPKRVDGKLLSLNSLSQMVQVPLKGNQSKINYYSTEVQDQCGETSINESSWVIMTKAPIPNSQAMTLAAQKQLIHSKGGDAGYVTPSAVSVVVCIIVHHIEGQLTDYLYGRDPWSCTRCEEVVGGFPVVVGGSGSTGFDISCCRLDGNGYGIGALREFRNH